MTIPAVDFENHARKIYPGGLMIFARGSLRLTMPIFAFFFILSSPIAFAVKMDRSAAAKNADVIILAKIGQTGARWVEDDRGRHIYTYAAVQSQQYLKGSGKSQETVEFPGGTVGMVTESVSDFPAVT
ncbi:MAG: hypothetical protein Q8N81_00085, partial [bacterium]|nr:hypothetical protein [bacterium]